MIIEAEIISQPYSGEYNERIYDNESVWNSQSWTFIKFTNDDYSEWCGQFRGFPRQVAISTPNKIVLVLTSDYLYQLDRETGNLTDLKDKPQYQNLTVAPNGDFILADYYNFEKVITSIKKKTSIESPIHKQDLFVGFLTGSSRIPILKNIKVGDNFKTVINKLGYSYLKFDNVLLYHDWNNTIAKFVIKDNLVNKISVVRYDINLSKDSLPSFILNERMIPEREY